MSTPTPGKLPLSQQGKTPSQHHGAAPTPAASTPFSVTQAVFSPLGPRSSPQQVKKSPVTMGNMGRGGPVNFESPSAAAALGGLDLPTGLDTPGSLPVPNLGRASEDERARRLEAVIAMLDVGAPIPKPETESPTNNPPSEAKAWSVRQASRG